MSFVQIVTFTTRKLDEIRKLDQEWQADTEGRRTLLHDSLYADRAVPNRYVVINEFGSYESAMTNSALPETTAFAERAAELCEGPASFLDLDLVEDGGNRSTELAARLVHFLETNEAVSDLFTDDVLLDMNVPLWRFQLRGVEAITEMLVADGPYGRRFEEHRVTPTLTGFVLHWSWRTTGGDGYESHYARGVCIVDIDGGLIGRLTVHCSGDWDPATEAKQLAEAPMVERS